MTKAEYEAKRKAGLDAGFTPIATAINDMLIKDEYIASLEAENEGLRSSIAELEKSIENHLNASKIAFEALQSWDANIAKNYAVILLLNQSPEPPRDKE